MSTPFDVRSMSSATRRRGLQATVYLIHRAVVAAGINAKTKAAHSAFIIVAVTPPLGFQFPSSTELGTRGGAPQTPRALTTRDDESSIQTLPLTLILSLYRHFLPATAADHGPLWLFVTTHEAPVTTHGDSQLLRPNRETQILCSVTSVQLGRFFFFSSLFVCCALQLLLPSRHGRRSPLN